MGTVVGIVVMTLIQLCSTKVGQVLTCILVIEIVILLTIAL